MILDRELLAILQCPTTGARLIPAGDELATDGGGSALRYPVSQGIPILVAGARADAAIVESFKTRSLTYYGDNYGADGNAERQSRQAIVLDALRSSTTPGARVLEAGAGPAVLGRELTMLTHGYVALDVSLENLLAGRRRLGSLSAVVGDLTALPFRSATFEVVVAIGCLEYVEDLPVAISELARVTAPGGTILTSFANAASPRRWWDERVAHPIIGAIRRGRKTSGASYRRWLHRLPAIEERFIAADCEVVHVQFYGAAFTGYPLSRSERLRSADERLTSRSQKLARCQHEFLLRLRRGGSPRDATGDARAAG